MNVTNPSTGPTERRVARRGGRPGRSGGGGGGRRTGPGGALRPGRRPARSVTLVLALLALAGLARGQAGAPPGPGGAGSPAGVAPPTLTDVRFEQRLGEQVPGDVPLVDADGTALHLSDLLGREPALLVPVYYGCPMLCSQTLNGLARALKALSFTAGDGFQVIVFSVDPTEGPDLAREGRETFLERYGRDEAAAGVHFLTADQPAIATLTDAIGFHYVRDPDSGQIAHAAGLLVLTPEGLIARAFLGVEFPARDLRLALVEAADGKLGSVVDQVLLYCFQYDPSTGRYSAAVLNLVRAGGVFTLLVLGGFLFWSRHSHARAEAGRA